jgi:hypothetical protein
MLHSSPAKRRFKNSEATVMSKRFSSTGGRHVDSRAANTASISRTKGAQGLSDDGFQVQPRHWVVKRTFAWLMRYRLVRYYEQGLDVSETMMYIALGSPLLQRMLFWRVFKPFLRPLVEWKSKKSCILPGEC